MMEHLKLLDKIESVCYTTSMSSKIMKFPKYVVMVYNVKTKKFHSQQTDNRITFYGDFEPGDEVLIYTTKGESDD